MAGVRNDDRLWPNVSKHLPYFIEIENRIKNLKSSDLANQEIEKLYQYFKLITPEFFDGQKFQGGYRYLSYKLLECEKLLPTDFIVDKNPVYIYGMLSDKTPKTKNITDMLNWIVYMTRKSLHIKNYSKESEFNKIDLSNQCYISSNKVKEYAKLLNLDCKTCIIYPGFTKQPELYNGNGYHCISIITYDNKSYIIDCTYSQFFTLKRNNLERIGLIGISGCLPGIFMTMKNDRYKLAQEILENGWFQATNENVKKYFDGFAISYRNGLYYQITGNYNYTTTYDASNYIEFLQKLDNQVNHEGEEVLGYQRTLTPKNKY